MGKEHHVYGRESNTMRYNEIRGMTRIQFPTLKGNTHTNPFRECIGKDIDPDTCTESVRRDTFKERKGSRHGRPTKKTNFLELTPGRV